MSIFADEYARLGMIESEGQNAARKEGIGPHFGVHVMRRVISREKLSKRVGYDYHGCGHPYRLAPEEENQHRPEQIKLLFNGEGPELACQGTGGSYGRDVIAKEESAAHDPRPDKRSPEEKQNQQEYRKVTDDDRQNPECAAYVERFEVGAFLRDQLRSDEKPAQHKEKLNPVFTKKEFPLVKKQYAEVGIENHKNGHGSPAVERGNVAACFRGQRSLSPVLEVYAMGSAEGYNFEGIGLKKAE